MNGTWMSVLPCLVALLSPTFSISTLFSVFIKDLWENIKDYVMHQLILFFPLLLFLLILLLLPLLLLHFLLSPPPLFFPSSSSRTVMKSAVCHHTHLSYQLTLDQLPLPSFIYSLGHFSLKTMYFKPVHGALPWSKWIQSRSGISDICSLPQSFKAGHVQRIYV